MYKKGVLLSHPTGNANLRAIANGLVLSENLHSFHTSIAVYPNTLFDYLSNFGPLKELKRRSFHPTLKEFTFTYPYRDLGRSFANKLGWKNLIRKESGVFSIDQIYRSLDLEVSKSIKKYNGDHIHTVYAYEDAALKTFTEAKKRGITCVYDLPIAYWETGRKLMLEEADRHPEWASTLGGGIMDSEEKLEMKTKELELADVVVGPGTFVMNSLPDWAVKKELIMAPFGSPEPDNSRVFTDSTIFKKNRKLRVLFVGSMGQRKGLADLFSAMKILNRSDIELVVLGNLLNSMDFYRREYKNFKYESNRSHDKVLELMRSCDILCLPSIVEGRALVIQEAMSQGLPVIITSNTGGEDLIKEEQTGFLVPIRSPSSIAEKLEWFLDNKETLKDMGTMAKLHAAKYTWENYADQVVDGILRINKTLKPID